MEWLKALTKQMHALVGILCNRNKIEIVDIVRTYENSDSMVDRVLTAYTNMEKELTIGISSIRFRLYDCALLYHLRSKISEEYIDTNNHQIRAIFAVN